jgi:hypothetical protein
MSKGGGQGSFAQMQEPGLDMDMGGFGGQPQPAVSAAPSFAYSVGDQNFGNIQEARQYAFDTYGNLDDVRAYEPPPVERVTNIQPMPAPLMQNQGPDNINAGLGSKGGRSNPYQTDGIVPPTMRGELLPGRRQFDPIDQPIARPDPAPRRTNRYTDAEYSAAEAQAREILGLPPKGGGRVYAGGTPNFDERTGEFRTGGIKPPRGPVKLEPIKMQPMPTPAPERINLPTIPDYMREDLESRGTVGPGGGTRGRTGSFRDAIREFRDEFRYQPMPRREPPIFGPPRNFPFPMPKPPRMPPRQPPRMPGRNTQFQMPFFGSQYGRMNPYQGQFSGYGVPSNMFSFAQPHYQPYVPGAYSPPSMYAEPTPTAPPVMQLPPGQGAPTFGGGYGGFSGGSGGIGGFGRYNLGLAYDQLF